MSVSMNRVTQGVSFNNGIRTAEWNEKPVGQTLGQTQQPLLPGETTVSEALESVFPKDPTLSAQILGLLAAAGNSTLLRTSNGFHLAAKKAISNLRGKKSEKAKAAADELENLLSDTELLDFYRASLLET